MRMKRQLRDYALALVCVLLVVPGLARATEVSFQSDTLLRVFERDTTQGTDEQVLPVYEYLQADFDSLGGNNKLAFHFYGWGRVDLADSEFYEDTDAGELLYGYLEYTGEQASFRARLGRQYVFEGVANEAVDGLRLSSDLGKYFSASVYAGQPAALDATNGRDGDSIYGGRIAHRFGPWYDVGVSYKQIENDSVTAEEMLGLDLGVYLPKGISFYGFSARNLETEDWGEHSYELRFKMAGFSFRPFMQQYTYEDQFGTGANNANPFAFLASTNEELTVIGGDILYREISGWDFGFKIKSYDYDLSNETSDFFSVLATRHDEEGNSTGVEYGVMSGDAPENEYSLLRAFFYREQLPEGLPLEFVSGDVVWVDYEQAVFNENSSLFVSLGTGRHFLDDTLEVKLSGDYSSDPYFDEDVRGMLTVSFAYDAGM